MPSITSWTRIEPSTRNKDMSVGLQAQIEDPLWLLARQYQLGEFNGEDAGSPIQAHLQALCARLNLYHRGPLVQGATPTVDTYDVGNYPLEAMVESERVHLGGDVSVKVAAEAGLHFLRLLSAYGAGRYQDEYVRAYDLDPSLLRTSDLRAPGSLAMVLHQPPNALSQYIRGKLTVPLQQQIDKYASAAFADQIAAQSALVGALVGELNGIVQGPCLYDQQNVRGRFSGIALSQQTRELAERAAAGKLPKREIPYVNRLLLEEAYPDPIAKPDDGPLRFFRVLAHRVPDGARLYSDLDRALRGGIAAHLPASPLIVAEDRQNVIQAALAWLKWYDDLVDEPAANDESPWISERLEYQFAVSGPAPDGGSGTADKEIVLMAPEYEGGNLDWYSFRGQPDAPLGAGSVSPVAPINITGMPSPIRYPGMPAARWWEFEDAKVDLGSVETAAEDLARMLVLEFALVYGNDWFMIPVDLEVGSFCRVESLVVTDTFGVKTLIRPYREVDKSRLGEKVSWAMFRLSPDARATSSTPEKTENVFFLAPTLGPSLASPPIEEVLFLRDEMANIAWAVERVVESAAGRPLNRFEAFQEERRRRAEKNTSPPASHLAPIVYRLAANLPPDHWIPLVPQQIGGGTSIRLVRGKMLRTSADEPSKEPQGHILQPNQSLRLYDEEVPRSGKRITRVYRYARWIDGSAHLWIAREEKPGRGEGSSGLRFDAIEHI